MPLYRISFTIQMDVPIYAKNDSDARKFAQSAALKSLDIEVDNLGLTQEDAGIDALSVEVAPVLSPDQHEYDGGDECWAVRSEYDSTSIASAFFDQAPSDESDEAQMIDRYNALRHGLAPVD